MLSQFSSLLQRPLWSAHSTTSTLEASTLVQVQWLCLAQFHLHPLTKSRQQPNSITNHHHNQPPQPSLATTITNQKTTQTKPPPSPPSPTTTNPNTSPTCRLHQPCSQSPIPRAEGAMRQESQAANRGESVGQCRFGLPKHRPA